MTALLPTLADLQHAGFWILCVLVVAVILGGLFSFCDQLFSHGIAHVREALQRPILNVRIPAVREDSDPRRPDRAAVIDIASARRGR